MRNLEVAVAKTFCFLLLAANTNILGEKYLKTGNGFPKIFLKKFHVPNRSPPKLETKCNYRENLVQNRTENQETTLTYPSNILVTSETLALVLLYKGDLM